MICLFVKHKQCDWRLCYYFIASPTSVRLEFNGYEVSAIEKNCCYCMISMLIFLFLFVDETLPLFQTASEATSLDVLI